MDNLSIKELNEELDEEKDKINPVVFIIIVTCKCNKEQIISICDSFKQAKKILGTFDNMLAIQKNVCYNVIYHNKHDGNIQICKEFKISINTMTKNIICNNKLSEFIIEIKNNLFFTY